MSKQPYLFNSFVVLFYFFVQTACNLTGWTEVIFSQSQISFIYQAGSSAICSTGYGTYNGVPVLGTLDCFGNNGVQETSVYTDTVTVPSPNKIKFQATFFGYRSWTTFTDSTYQFQITEQINNDVKTFSFFENPDITTQLGSDCVTAAFEYVIDHSGGSVFFAITQIGPSLDVSFQSWGISNIVISSHPCYKGCDVCVDYGTCVTCDLNYFLVAGFCQDYCPDKQYGNNSSGMCENCDANCQSCSGPGANECITCYGDLIKDSTTLLCSCPQFYYYVDPNCFACESTCGTCADATTCLTCKDGYYKDPSGPFCLPCHESCETCNSASTCLTCSRSKNRYLVGSTCECVESYFERSLSLTYDNTLTRSDYSATVYGSCLACPFMCSKCTDENTCTTCKNETIENGSGSCICKIEFVENVQTGKCEETTSTGSEIAKIINEQATFIATGTVVVALPSILLGNPAVALQSMAIIQVLKYNLFVNVKYPQIVEEFFALFEQADGSALAKVFVDFETQKMRSSYGFHVHDIDSMFLRNSFQNIQSVCVLALAYISIKFIIINFIKKSPNIQKVNNALSGSKQEEKPLNACEIESVRRARILSREKGINAKVAEQNQIDQITALNVENNKITNKILTKVIEAFEWGLFLGTIEAGFLNLCTFSFLQLQNASVTSIPQLISFLIAFLISGLLVLFVLSMYFIVQKIHESSKTISLISPINNEKSTIFPLRDTHEKTLSIDEKLTERKIGIEEQIMKSFQMVHMLFVPGKILKQGFYLVVVIRKLIYSIFLVFAYKYPQIVLSVFITLNSSMIFILIKYKPYKESIYCIRDILTELFLCILHFLTFPLTNSDFMNDNSNNEQYNLLGTYMFFTIGAIIIVQLICIVHDSLRQIINAIRKEPPIPETPIIPETPSLSRMEEKEVNQAVNLSSSENSLAFRKKGTELGFKESHESAINNQLINSNTKSVLLDLFEQIQGSQSMKDQNKNQKEYEQTLFLANVAVSLNKITKQTPDKINLSMRIQQNPSSPVQPSRMQIMDVFENSLNISANQSRDELNNTKLNLNPQRSPNIQQSSLNLSPQKLISRNSSASQISSVSLNEKSPYNQLAHQQHQQQEHQTSSKPQIQTLNQSNSMKMGVNVKSMNSSLSNSRAVSQTNLHNIIPVNNSDRGSIKVSQNGVDSNRRIHRFDLKSIMEEEMNRVFQKNTELQARVRRNRQSRLLNIIQSE